VVLIGGVVYWAYKTGKLEQIRQAMLQYVKGEKKEEKKQEPVQQKQQAAPKLPPINQACPKRKEVERAALWHLTHRVCWRQQFFSGHAQAGFRSLH
jgi:hypothetical protein